MDAISSVLDALAWPVLPAQAWPQAAFLSVLLLLVAGLLMLSFPATAGRVAGLAGTDARPGGIGELRAIGGFLAGLSAATLMFFDQPVLAAAMGTAMAFACFARLISLMSDGSASLLNLLLLLVEAFFAIALLYYFTDAVTPDLEIGMPRETLPLLVFFTFAAMAAVGFLVLFAPRIAMNLAGLWVTAERPGGIASIRSTGGFLLGSGLFGMAISGYWQSQFVMLLMLGFGMLVALVFSLLGRVLAMLVNRGNLVFNGVALALQAAAAAIMLAYVGGAM